MKVNAEWKVTKKVTSKVKKVTGKPGSTVKVPYRVEASAKGVIRDLKVTGQMSVTNKDARDLTYTLEAILLNGPHDADGMPIEEAMRSVNGSKCTFNAKDADPNKPGHQVVVASGQSLNVKYNCTSDDGWFDAAEINTAPYSFWTYLKAMTAMGFEKEAASSIYAPVDASGVKVQDAVVNVWDFNSDADGGDAFELGKADASKGKTVFDYTMNVTIPTVKCYDYVNNAIVSGADGDALALDSAVVEACPEAPKAAVKPAGALKDGVNAGAAAATTGNGESGRARPN
ncbi:hypothetical protein [Micrococcoides hystricis]|uniref:DUF11 domain-containing protein n=1 Tax=Micrococcoides hystricis TaxID=1572761 RepID=A0ABV6PCT0_9MICC